MSAFRRISTAAAGSPAGATPARAPTSPPSWCGAATTRGALAMLWGGNFLRVLRRRGGTGGVDPCARSHCRTAPRSRPSARAPGTWARAGAAAAEEADALRLGIDLGMTLIDTAEMYGDGGAETGRRARPSPASRDRVFIVSKVYPHNASRARRAGGLRAQPEAAAHRPDRPLSAALARQRPLAETVAAFEPLRAGRQDRATGASPISTPTTWRNCADAGGAACATNQVLYNPDRRGIEFDLLPWCAEHGIPVMAYSPVGQGGRLLRNPALASIAARHGATPAQIALAWTLLRRGRDLHPQGRRPRPCCAKTPPPPRSASPPRTSPQSTRPSPRHAAANPCRCCNKHGPHCADDSCPPLTRSREQVASVPYNTQ